MNRIRSKVSTDVLSKGFKAGKCKTSLKLAMARIKLLKNKREVQVRQMRRDVAKLLEDGHDQTARIRVEHVIREEKTMSAYELIEIYCELIVARLPIIESQKSCPIDLKEAICSVVFASPRCADIPELMDVRKHFVAKYGKEFINSALEVRPGCGVNRMIVEKLSAVAPDVETKIKILTAIAQEHNVKWDSKAFEEQFHKPNDDLLNGPNTFGSSSRMPMESFPASLSSATNQKHDPTMKSPQNDMASKPTSMNTSSHTNISTPSASVSSTSQYGSRVPDSRSGEEFKIPSSSEVSASLDRPVWNMEFKDATAAAQAAAESAERASMAARAAAELASRENVSRQSSSGTHESSAYDRRHNNPVKSKASKPEVAGIVRESLTKEEVERRSSQGVNLDEQKFWRDEASQRRENENIYGDHASFKSRPLSRGDVFRQPSTGSHESSTYDISHNKPVNSMSSKLEGADIAHASVTKEMDELRRSQGMNLDEHNLQEEEVSPKRETESIYGDHASFNSRPLSRSSSDSSGTSLDDSMSEVNLQKSDMKAYGHDFNDDILWDSTIREHDNVSGEDSRTGNGEGIFVSDKKQPGFSNNPVAVFDDYGSDTDDINLLDSFLPNQREPSSFSSNVDTFSHRSESAVKESGSELNYVTEPHSMEHSETKKSDFFPSQSSAAFDDSDGLSSETEGDIDSSLVSSRGYGKNDETVQKSSDKIWERSSSDGLPKSSSINDKTSMESISSDRGTSYYSNEEPQSQRSSKVSAIAEAEKKEKFGMPPSQSDARDTDILNELNSESGLSLNLGRLTGGLKHKGFQHPPYVKSPMEYASIESPDEKSYDKKSHLEDYKSIPRISRTRMESHVDKDEELVSRRASARRGYRGEASLSSEMSTEVTKEQSTDFPPAVEAPKVDLYDKRPHRKAYNELSSRAQVTYFESDDEESVELDKHHTIGHRIKKDAMLSRRTRNLPSEDTQNSHLRSNTEKENKPSQASAAFEPPSNTTPHSVNLDREESSRSLRAKPSVRQPSVTLTESGSSADRSAPKSPKQDVTESVVRENNVNPTASGSTAGSISRESSLKNASHVHPKLPNYDDIAAHFLSLRANKR